MAFTHRFVKKTVAACLVILLLFIQIGKAFHTHSVPVTLKINTNAASFQYSCAVCDYQLAKDADNYTFSFGFIQPKQQPESFNIYIVAACKSLHHFSQLRGPPYYSI